MLKRLRIQKKQMLVPMKHETVSKLTAAAIRSSQEILSKTWKIIEPTGKGRRLLEDADPGTNAACRWVREERAISVDLLVTGL